MLAAAAWLAPAWGPAALAALSAWLAWPLLMQTRPADPALPWRRIGGLRIRLPENVDALLARSASLCAAQGDNRSGTS